MVYLPTELECKHQSHPSHRDGAWGWKFLRGKVLVLEAGELYDVQVKEPYSPLSWMETWHNKYLGKELRRQSHPTGHFVTHKEYLGHSLLKPCLSVVIDWHTAYVGLGSWNIKTRVSLLMSSFLTLFFFLVGIQFFPKAGTILFTFLKTLQRAGLHAVSKYMLLMDSFQLPLMLITLKGLGGGDYFSQLLSWELHLFLIFPSHSRSLNVSFQCASRFLCFLSHHQRCLAETGTMLLSCFHIEGLCCAKYCFMLLSWSALHNCLEKSTFVDNPKEGKTLNTLLLERISWVKCIKILL